MCCTYAQAICDTIFIFKQSLTGLKAVFSFCNTDCLTKVKEPILSYYLPMIIGRIVRFIPFQSLIARCEM